jgi:hypothetical protein
MGVTGIGGFFFRAKDPEAIRAWYVEHLGVGSVPYGSWETQAGLSVFAPFAVDADYFLQIARGCSICALMISMP